MHVSVEQLHVNPGQMRTELDLDQLAQLAFQIAERGLDADRPLLLTQVDGQGAYRVVRGHRRWLAAMIAEHARTLHDELDVETMRQVIEDLVTVEVDIEVCDACGSVVEPLSKYPAEDVPDNMLKEPDRWRVCENCNSFTDEFEPTTTQVTDPDHIFTLYETLPNQYPHILMPATVEAFDSPLAEQLSLTPALSLRASAAQVSVTTLGTRNRT